MKITWSPPVMKNYWEWKKYPIDIELWFAWTLIWNYISIANSYFRRIVERITLSYKSPLRRKLWPYLSFSFCTLLPFLLFINMHTIILYCFTLYICWQVRSCHRNILKEKNLLVNMVCFHLSLSGCGMGSLETCTHIISMPESHIITPIQFNPDLIPTHIPKIIVRAYKQFINPHIITKYAVKCFHLSLSGYSMGSLETCTHVIPMLESHTVTPIKFYPDVIPTYEQK